MRAFLVMRSRFAEDQLALAVSRGVTQYVVLGRRSWILFAYAIRTGTCAYSKWTIRPRRRGNASA